MATNKLPKSSRKWFITINNPDEHDLSHEKIVKLLNKLPNLEYFCMCDEIGGDTETYHTHIFEITQNCVSFSRLKKLFPTAHFDRVSGSNLDCYNYVRKEGKWLDSEKSTTNLKETFLEFGILPEDKQGKRSDLEELYNLVYSGYTNGEIIGMCPDYIMQIDKIDRIRKSIQELEYREKWRDVKVHYIWGLTGTGKTRFVMEKYGYANVCKITNYDRYPFDNYNGQSCLLFDEYRGQIKISDMLQYIDGYPLLLPARYGDRVAQYTDVYIISNEPLSKQYENVQKNQMETFRALLRRIQDITYYNKEGSYTYECNEQTYLYSRAWCDYQIPIKDFDESGFEDIAL